MEWYMELEVWDRQRWIWFTLRLELSTSFGKEVVGNG